MDEQWEELHRSVTDPWLIKPGPTWIVISTRGKQTVRDEDRARALERTLGRDWVRTHYVNTSVDVRVPIRFEEVQWQRRMTAHIRGTCHLVCQRHIINGDDIVFAVRRYVDGTTRSGWIHTGCAEAGVLL